MNEFIRLRKSMHDYNDRYNFTQVYLEKYLEKDHNLTLDQTQFLERLKALQEINISKNVDIDTLKELLSYLGADPYLDRLSMDTILSFYKESFKDDFSAILKEKLMDPTIRDEVLYHLLDLSLELDLDILSTDKVLSLFDDNLDLITLLIEVLDQFDHKLSKEYLLNLISSEFTFIIKIQVLNLLDKLHSLSTAEFEQIKEKIKVKEDDIFIDTYLEFLQGKKQRKQEGVVLLQSMFYGDFEDSGKGNNGGLAILLRSLGNEVSKDPRIDCVFTLTISDRSDKPFMLNYKDDHIFVRLPAYLDRTVNDPFLKRELFIKRSIEKFLIKLEVQPDIYHIRYLDNASIAVAKLSKEQNKKLVLTLAPDPHRNMVNEKGIIKNFNFNELQVLLNKIMIGDHLISESHQILGIGEKKVKKELDKYFPQFTYDEVKDKVKMIAEGITTDDDMFIKAEDVDVCELKDLIGIPPSFCGKPIILNVGRLATLKGQVALFKAWSTSKLNETHNLLIIGGDLEKPNKEEKMIIDFFKEELLKNPSLKNKFFHQAALANKKIQRVEKSIMTKRFDYPHIYIASSLKEEFGIAILESMSRGFLVFAPLKGGVKSYITTRENGFLIDTSSGKTIARDSLDILYNSGITNEEFKQIQKAGRDTIEREFSIDKIAKTFTDTYLSLLGEKKNEV